jgi:hypothetical protein
MKFKEISVLSVAANRDSPLHLVHTSLNNLPLINFAISFTRCSDVTEVGVKVWTRFISFEIGFCKGF